jgi:hypothetical protein
MPQTGRWAAQVAGGLQWPWQATQAMGGLHRPWAGISRTWVFFKCTLRLPLSAIAHEDLCSTSMKFMSFSWSATSNSSPGPIFPVSWSATHAKHNVRFCATCFWPKSAEGCTNGVFKARAKLRCQQLVFLARSLAAAHSLAAPPSFKCSPSCRVLFLRLLKSEPVQQPAAQHVLSRGLGFPVAGIGLLYMYVRSPYTYIYRPENTCMFDHLILIYSHLSLIPTNTRSSSLSWSSPDSSNRWKRRCPFEFLLFFRCPK